VGDVISFSGTDPDGTTLSGSFTYGTDGTTVGELIDVISDVYSGVTVSLGSNGTLRLTDAVAGESETSISLAFEDNGTSSLVTLPQFTTLVEGKDAESHTTSTTIYDSKGDTHTFTMTFTNVSSADRQDIWRWEATIDNGEITPVGGNKGFVKFANDGSLAGFEIDDDLPLTFDPSAGSERMQITLDPGDIGSYTGITQMDSPATTHADHQDGYGMGNLYKIAFDENGTITGLFTNGVNQILGQVALAEFNNPSGLERAGNNLYEAGANSGTAVRGYVGSTIQATISSGALEMSTVDLAQEFTDMIVAQRGFQANARVITTSDTLLDEVVRLKR
jgi:flagellar hook protein FlgE